MINKVFCLGLAKTGTTSLHRAFLELGLKSIHHGPPDSKTIAELKQGHDRLIEQIRQCKQQGELLLKYLHEYDAYCDIGAIIYDFELLDRQYPNSKFIYTDRQMDDWLDSMVRHVERNVENVGKNLYQTNFVEIEEEKWRSNKIAHLERVKAYFKDRPQDLLSMNIIEGDGYEKLCPFLGLEIPNSSFPCKNTDNRSQQSSPTIARSTNNSYEVQLKNKLLNLQKDEDFSEIGRLISQTICEPPPQFDRRILGYLPSFFRETEVFYVDRILHDLVIYPEEPVIYKIHFPPDRTICGISFFYLFGYLKPDTHKLNVYFQSARRNSKSLCQNEYDLARQKVFFEGLIDGFENPDLSFISISDPGHFISGLNSSFYAGSKEINFSEIIADVLTSVCHLAKIKLSDTLLFGSSAGSMGALLTSTYLGEKTNVFAVNSQIETHRTSQLVKILFDTEDADFLLRAYGDRLSCFDRFYPYLPAVPNLYLLANINDELYSENWNFYQHYQKCFVDKGKNNQSVFDSYYGVAGHNRPDKPVLKAKIKTAREILTTVSNLSE
jgi:hypothetical protein